RARRVGDEGRLVAMAGRGQLLALADAWLRPDARAVAAADHSGRPAAFAQRLHGGDDHRRLAGAADVDVADDHDRHGGAVYGAAAGLVLGAAPRDVPGGQGGQGAQQRGQPAVVLPVALRKGGARRRGLHRAFWAAKLTRPMPARRAASMTLTTDWWEACASALISSSGCGLPAAASVRACAMSAGPAASTSVPLTA